MKKKNYIQTNKDWLEARARVEGVKTLSGNVCYKVLAEGNAGGEHPNLRSIVTVHYTGRTIDGHMFDSSLGGTPPAMHLGDLIEGWGIALQKMRIGDKWEIYIPADKGYGRYPQPGIPGGSTLIFVVELLGIA